MWIFGKDDSDRRKRVALVVPAPATERPTKSAVTSLGGGYGGGSLIARFFHSVQPMVEYDGVTGRSWPFTPTVGVSRHPRPPKYISGTRVWRRRGCCNQSNYWEASSCWARCKHTPAPRAIDYTCTQRASRSACSELVASRFPVFISCGEEALDLLAACGVP